MSYFKVLGLAELGLVGIHALQLMASNLDFSESFFWWLTIHSIMIYFVFTEFYSEVEKNAESSIRSIPLKKKPVLRPTKAQPSNVEDEPWYKKFLNMCMIDHALLYDNEEDNEVSEGEETVSARKKISN